MRRLHFILLILGIAFLSSGYTANPVHCLPDPNRPDIAGAENIVQGYLDAVDRGELVIFGRKLGRSEITPVRVEYVYDIASGSMETWVRSNLKTPMPVPGQPGAEVRCVNSVVDEGKIVETESHVWIE